MSSLEAISTAIPWACSARSSMEAIFSRPSPFVRSFSTPNRPGEISPVNAPGTIDCSAEPSISLETR